MPRFLTYTFSRPFFGLNIPIPVQSVYLRDYAAKNKLDFTLPTTEICFGNSYYSLSNIFRALKNDEHFGAVSIMVLPLDNNEEFNNVINLIDGKSIILHFPLEGFRGGSAEVRAWRVEFNLMRSFQRSDNEPTNLILENRL